MATHESGPTANIDAISTASAGTTGWAHAICCGCCDLLAKPAAELANNNYLIEETS